MVIIFRLDLSWTIPDAKLRRDRVCDHCDMLEDKFHAIFVSPRYDSILSKFADIFSERNISVFLNPTEDQI